MRRRFNPEHRLKSGDVHEKFPTPCLYEQIPELEGLPEEIILPEYEDPDLPLELEI